MKNTLLIIAMLFAFIVSAKNYKGAEIYSSQSYLYGRFEMRIKSAPGSGQLSTFFLYRNNSEQNTTLWQEIDIEIFGKDTNLFQTNVIIEKVEGSQLGTEKTHYTKRSLSGDYHIYVLEWTPDSINWYVDDSLFRTEKDYAKSCNAAMSLRFNHWAHTSSSWVGTFDTKVLPQYQYVDYISYSAYTPGEGDNGTDYKFSWKDDFTSFDNSRWSKANWTFGGNYCDFEPANAYTEDDKLVLKLYDATPPPVVTSSSLVDNEKSSFNIYPNPFSSSVSVTIESDEEYCVKISNMYGTVVFEQCGITENNIGIVSTILSNLDNGMYVVVLQSPNKTLEYKTLLKN
ncbi:MAG: family 16 glycosylhydrolase [Bacteroidales bacterium]|nr:family 16 glycosylhydrolase [Bacteroidales bacterium]